MFSAFRINFGKNAILAALRRLSVCLFISKETTTVERYEKS